MPSPCCITGEPLCLYVDIDSVKSDLGCLELEDEKIEELILDAMCTIDSYIGSVSQTSYFPRECDRGCIPRDVARATLILALNEANRACSGCSSSFSDAMIVSESLAGCSVTYRTPKVDDGFPEIPMQVKSWLKKYKLSGGYFTSPSNGCRFQSRKLKNKCTQQQSHTRNSCKKCPLVR